MTTTSPTPAPGWYPDPSGRFGHRYWDGAAWTAHVSTNGQDGIDPPPDTPAQALPPVVLVFTEAVDRDVNGAPFDITTPDGTLVAFARSPQQAEHLSNVTRTDYVTEYRTSAGHPVFAHVAPGGMFVDTHQVFAPDGHHLGSLDIDVGFGKVHVKVLIGGQEVTRLRNEGGMLAYVATDPNGALLARYRNDRTGSHWRGRGHGHDTWTVELAPQLLEPLHTLLLAAVFTLNIRDDRSNINPRRGVD